MALRENGIGQRQWAVRLTINGESFGVWDNATGGGVDSDELKYSPGRMADQVSLGGRTLPENLVLQRLYDLKDDHDRINTLLNGVGKAKVSASKRPMDQDGNEYGKSIIYQGKLKRVAPPEAQSEANSAALLEIEVSVAGKPIAQ